MDSRASGGLASRGKARPFTEMEQTFGSLEEARKWLGDAEIYDTGGKG